MVDVEGCLYCLFIWSIAPSVGMGREARASSSDPSDFDEAMGFGEVG
jgi:hypothetical protein